MSGAYVVVEIAYMFGQTLQLWSFRMALMDGFVLSLMVNLLQCIRVEALKMAVIVQVNFNV